MAPDVRPVGPAGPGPGVDAQGLPVIDPTANVISIIEAAVRRQDDLRAVEAATVRELMARDQRHADQMRAMDDKLRDAESKRIDAIRAVDVAAVQTATTAADARALTLQTQVNVSAETLRNQVTQAAIASDQSLRNALEPIQKAIQDLTNQQSVSAGAKGQASESTIDRRGGNALLVAILALTATILLGAAGIIITVVAAS